MVCFPESQAEVCFSDAFGYKSGSAVNVLSAAIVPLLDVWVLFNDKNRLQ